MNLVLEIDTSTLSSELREVIEKDFKGVAAWIQDSMATTLLTLVVDNFGASGSTRPTDWAPLRMAYALQYHDGDRTPTLVLSGDLRQSIDITYSSDNGGEFATVFTECPYASLHQFGGVNDQGYAIPARPFFPILDGEMHPAAVAALQDAAWDALDRYVPSD